MKVCRFFSLLILVSIFASAPNAQLVWKKSIELTEGELDINIYATSNYRNTFYVVGTVFDNVTDIATVNFFRSENGGKTWKRQDSKVYGYSGKWGRSYRLQQIDSLNVVAIVDSGIIVRTFDGGGTWHIQTIDEGYTPNNVHFHDSSDGIISVGGIDDIVFVTSNGGRTWQKQKTFADRPFTNCYSYGGGKYRGFSPTNINIFTTTNYWANIQPSSEIISKEDTTYSKYRFNKGKFTDSDIVFAFGEYRHTSDGLLVRSIDAGFTWEKPVHLFENPPILTHMSDANRDTIYAGGFVLAAKDLLLFSSDKGKTWRVDTLISDVPVIEYELCGVETDDLGRVMIASRKGVFYGEDTSKLSVERGYKIRYYSYIYPNPANERVTIESFLGGKEVQLIDLLGRKVMSGTTEPDGKITFNVSTLSHGIYGILLRRDEGLVTVGKVAVTGGVY